MDKIKRNERLGAMTRILTDSSIAFIRWENLRDVRRGEIDDQ